jgi:hypothetical protein
MKKEAYKGRYWAALCDNVDHHHHGIVVFIAGHDTRSPLVTPRWEGVIGGFERFMLHSLINIKP